MGKGFSQVGLLGQKASIWIVLTGIADFWKMCGDYGKARESISHPHTQNLLFTNRRENYILVIFVCIV